MHIQWNSTTALAIYASVLATITFVWNLLRDLRDRGKLKISAKVRRIVSGPDGPRYAVAYDFPAAEASKELYIVMTVANVGRRPMRWEGWGGFYKKPFKGKTSFVIIPRLLPKILAEMETHQEFTMLDDGFDNIKKLHIWDGITDEWKLSFWQMRRLRIEAKEARAPSKHL
jgi:hypothetical protein